MLAFLQPALLFALSAAAIPTLLHLLTRRQPPTVPFPAVRYLAETERRQSRRIKLRNLWLLLLRTLFVILLVLAAARPVASLGVGGGHAPTAIALVVDNSLSSGVVVSGRRVLDDLVDQARTVVGKTQTDDRLWIVLADGLPRRTSVTEAMALLDDLAPWARRLDLGAAVRAAERAMGGDVLAAREVVVLSDLQRSALSGGDPVGVPVLVAAPKPEPANHAVDSARVEPGVWSPVGSVYAAVGGAGAEPVPLRLELGGAVVARALGAPGDVVGLGGRASRPGWVAARVVADPDELRADDAWHLAVRVAPPAAVTADPSAGPYVAQALAVLRDGGRVRAGAEVVVGDRPAGLRAIVFPPADPAAVGAVNRALAARGLSTRFADHASGEWALEDGLGGLENAVVLRRHRLEGNGVVLARVGAEPWLVREGPAIVVASRMEPEWTALPVSAGFVPFMDYLVNRIAAGDAPVVSATPAQAVEIPPGPAEVVVGPNAVPVSGDRRLTAPMEPGVYFLRSASGDTVGALQVNHDPRESRLARADIRAVRASFGPLARVVGLRALERDVFGGAGRADLSGLTLGLALAVAVTELAVASGGGGARRREPGEP
ncbi:MAG TPA: BatA domain-containing protein [Gemmatimonadales bacterium]